MTHDPADDVLKDLETALSVTPSPEFAEGVRARIAEDAGRHHAWRVWSAVGLAAAAALVLMLVAFERRETTLPAAVTASRAPEPAAAAPVASSAAPVPSAVAAPRAVGVSASHVPDRRPRRETPEVLVPRDQADGLRALVARLKDGTIDVASLATPPPDATVPLPLIQDIVVPAIVIPSIEGVGPVGSGGDSKHPER